MIVPKPPVAATAPLLGLLLSVCVAACNNSDARPHAQAAAGQPPAPVVVATVERREHAPAIEAIGSARARESVLVTSRVSGRVQEIYFEESSDVAADARLVRLEDDEERAELGRAEAAASQAESRHRRTRELADQGLLPKDQLDDLSQSLKAARAALELARVRLAQRTVRAPFAGRLGFRQVSPGSLVQPGTAIVSLDAVDTLRAEFSIPETLLSGVAAGDTVEARAAAWPDRVFAGTINLIGTRVDEATRAVPLQALLDNADGSLKPGMLLSLTVRARPRTSLFVPEAALSPENAAQYVWRVKTDGTVEKVEVQLELRTPGAVALRAGVAEGDRVVVEGHANLRPGRHVEATVRPASGAAAQ